MSIRANTMKPHGKAVGYIIYSCRDGAVTTACHGDDGADTTLLYGSTVTLFPTRKAAERLIVKLEALGKALPGDLRTLLVAPLKTP